MNADILESLPACPVETTLTLIGNKWQVLKSILGRAVLGIRRRRCRIRCRGRDPRAAFLQHAPEELHEGGLLGVDVLGLPVRLDVARAGDEPELLVLG